MDRSKGVKVELNKDKPGQDSSTGIQVPWGGEMTEENSSWVSESSRGATAGRQSQ